ncbi:MAG: hypothetical protein A2Y12_18685 [Planctomycetes bacterium GWF2_42_9]|nr:MAG: hypothetical protein A2Y12_18685 [Planctomycetes bacterium GWF2_42_9]HAL45236.1 hypothetical protein [Phycisphaerales bacterium]
MTKKNIAANIVITLIVIIFLVVVIGLISIDGILRAGIQKAIKKQLNVESSVAKVSLKILSGTIEITNLKIANPQGYQFENILEAKSIFVKTSLGNLLSNPIEIEQIKIDGMVMDIEQKGLTNNINDILKSMPKKEKEPQVEQKAAKSVHITSLDINDLTVKAKLLPLPGKADVAALTIPSLHLSDLGGEKTSLADTIGKVFTEITNAVVKNGQNVLPNDMLDSMSNSLQGNFQNITEEGQKALEKTGEELKQKATESLKGIFKQK